ncbi:50S ribosomal protein L10 [Plasticicumulans sp.]|uniref:50S ribosomal protein L10 n=1 Tax=Plasticicumulans sp. TaxID=2307179 RepID=UPI002C26AF80|nr:50S ribosomal protein L10 [Plasticicumulans sp.]MBS0601663.1 50S ribosomal protein L10 [Pseudomonadota bacterium]HMV38710.1 50S ribosomal protein L10 [Plasticicumulans sp.]HMW30961.1 50S ribosomal protein L10 [Plasticicumulans sp.]HMW42538.1 50S ribosomal protein L10 [Plasticicumulans sp.]HMZ10709.1 50S ribosomal protein L10 [Plasticicumulans sp.]
MSLNLAEKQAVVAEVAEVAARSHSLIAAEYRGITVARLTNLRVKARENGVYLRVVKNTLARRAVQGTDFECISPSLVGPLVLAFSEEDPGAAARVFKEFLKEKDNDKLIVKALAFGGQLLGPQDLDALASMPTRDQAISLLMAVMKAPLDKFARTLNEIPGKLVRTVEAIRVQKAESEAA